MSSSNTWQHKNSTEEHVNCGTDDCCQMCDTAVVGDTTKRSDCTTCKRRNDKACVQYKIQQKETGIAL